MADFGRRRGRRVRSVEGLAVALAAGQTLRDAAAATGISERTATRRWADPDFRRRVCELRADAVVRATGKMADAMSIAADRLRELLSAESESVRLGACRVILEMAAKMLETTELSERLFIIEGRMNINEHEPAPANRRIGRAVS